MRKRSDYTRITIIGVAGDLFKANGYTETSVDSIASAAQTTKKTIYGYFADKRALFAAVIDDSVETSLRFIDDLDNLQKPEDVYAQLYRIAVAINGILFDPEYIQLLRVVIAEIEVQPDLQVILERGITMRSFQHIYELLVTANNRQLLHLKNPDFSSRMFLGGFLVGMFVDGLMDPTLKNLHRFSQGDLVEYVNEFIHTNGKLHVSTEIVIPKVSK
jgi:TetR/AcrR family transcriptional repressor of mexJK operon